MIVTQLLNHLTGKTTRDRLTTLESQIKTQNEATSTTGWLNTRINKAVETVIANEKDRQEVNQKQAEINKNNDALHNTSSDTLEELVLEIESQKVKDAESIANLASHIQQLYAYQDGSAERLLDLELVAHMLTGSREQRDSLRRIGERLTWIRAETAKQQQIEADRAKIGVPQDTEIAPANPLVERDCPQKPQISPDLESEPQTKGIIPTDPVKPEIDPFNPAYLPNAEGDDVSKQDSHHRPSYLAIQPEPDRPPEM